MEALKSKFEISICNINSGENGHKCGYCNNPKGSFSFGFEAEKYPVEVYEAMMNEGWRRCGDYTYRPNYGKSCCKLHSIRLNVEKFKIDKKQRQVMRRFRRYLSGEYEAGKEKEEKPQKEKNDNDKYKNEIFDMIKGYIESKLYIDAIKSYVTELKVNFDKMSVMKNANRKFGDYSSNVFILIQCAINTAIKAKNMSIDTSDLLSKLYESYSSYAISKKYNDKYDISPSSKTGHLNFIVKNKEEFAKYLSSFNKTEQKPFVKKEKSNQPERYTMDYYPELVTDPEIALPLKHTYTIELSNNIKITPEELVVYQKYQRVVHKDKPDEITEDRYNQAWGSTNLTYTKIPYPADFSSKTKHPEIYPTSYGTYKMIHRIDGKIIGVGIWDVLPHCLSSVYFYYDTDYSFLDLGIFSAIREIEYVKSFNSLIDNQFKYYVMGFYCENVQKLRYKGEYHPSDILDHLTMNYVPLDEVREILKDGKIHKLSKEKGSCNYGITSEEAATIIGNKTIKYRNKEYNMMQFVLSVYKYPDKIMKMLETMIITFGRQFIDLVQITAD